MKVVYLCGFDLNTGVAAAKRVLHVAKALELSGHEVSFIDICHQNQCDHAWNGFAVSSVKRGSNTLGQIKTKTYCRDIIKKIVNCDIVIAYNYPGIPLYLICQYCRKKRIRILADVADWPMPEGNFFHKVVMKTDIDIRMKIAHPMMDGLIVISDYLARFYQNQNLVVIPPMVDLEKTICSAGKMKNSGTLVLTTINTAGPEKEALNLLFSMFANVKEKLQKRFELHVIGMTQDLYERRYQEQVPTNIKENVVFLGRLTYEQTICEIGKSDFFVFFRKHSQITDAGFPTKFSEALSCGTPVITSRTSDLEKYMEEGKNGFFVETDYDLCPIMDMKTEEILEMKRFCENYRKFDYHEYAKQINDFLVKI